MERRRRQIGHLPRIVAWCCRRNEEIPLEGTPQRKVNPYGGACTAFECGCKGIFVAGEWSRSPFPFRYPMKHHHPYRCAKYNRSKQPADRNRIRRRAAFALYVQFCATNSWISLMSVSTLSSRLESALCENRKSVCLASITARCQRKNSTTGNSSETTWPSV
jgi:hypothetical protein